MWSLILQPIAEGSPCFVRRLQKSPSTGTQIRHPYTDNIAVFTTGGIHERYHRRHFRTITLRRTFQGGSQGKEGGS